MVLSPHHTILGRLRLQRQRILLGVFFSLASVFFAIAGHLPTPLQGDTVRISISVVQPSSLILNVTSPNSNGTYVTGQSVYIEITFDQVVYVDTTGGTPEIGLNSGGTGTYISGSGSNTLLFLYTIQNGETSPDLGYSTTGSLVLQGGTITNFDLVDVTLDLPIVGNAGSLSLNKNIIINIVSGGGAGGGGGGGISGGGGSSGGGPLLPSAPEKEEYEEEDTTWQETVVCPKTVISEAYTDVPEKIWYEQAVHSFLCKEYLDKDQVVFRAGDGALRSEVAKLVTKVHEMQTSTIDPKSFYDVEIAGWYADYVQRVAELGWMLGDDNCYGRSPCTFRPGAKITRAEFAAVLVRAFDLTPSYASQAFPDVPSYAWYGGVVQTVADHCILLGDDDTGLARPDDPINRAEMVTMFYRILEGDARCPHVNAQRGHSRLGDDPVYYTTEEQVREAQKAGTIQEEPEVIEDIPTIEELEQMLKEELHEIEVTSKRPPRVKVFGPHTEEKNEEQILETVWQRPPRVKVFQLAAPEVSKQSSSKRPKRMKVFQPPTTFAPASQSSSKRPPRVKVFHPPTKVEASRKPVESFWQKALRQTMWPAKEAAPETVPTVPLCSECDRCGEGTWNVCDERECALLGRCHYYPGIVVGACREDPAVCR